MAVYKDKWNGYKGDAWRVECYYKDWKGVQKRHGKRGFKTKKEALVYEREFLAKSKRDINMSFNMFVDIYLKDMEPQLKVSTFETKKNIIELHIKPYFENFTLSGVTPTDILQWQNELLSIRDEQGKGYSPVYLRTIHNQINAIFNHAVRYYDLPKNPCYKHKKMGRSKNKEMLYWTKEEYLKFSESMKSKPISYYAFQVLFWTGIRLGELIALTKNDFDFERNILRINKNLQVVKGEEVVLSPKTEKGNRQIDLPQFLCDELQEYFATIYKLDNDTRVFPIGKSYLHHEMNRGCKESGVKRIRVHDLRHSHAALLISLGYATIQIAERLGHDDITVTQNYAHLYPSVQKKMAASLDELNSVGKE